MKLDVLGIVIAAFAATAVACSSPVGTTLVVLPPMRDSGMVIPDTSTPTPDTGTPPPPSGDAGAATGVPCDVATMLASKCTVCHSDPPLASALAGLVTYADLMATSHEDPTKNEAQLSVFRMQDTSLPMPPGTLPPAADVTVLQNWITAGYPKGSCGSDGGTSPESGPPPADAGSSGVFAGTPAFVATSSGSGHHNPGLDCMSSCHNHGFTFGGTLYDGKGNPVQSAEVRLVDGTGLGISVYTGTNGNFYSSTAWTGPGKVGARNGTATVQMIETVATTGPGCNVCHSTTGTTTQIHLP